MIIATFCLNGINKCMDWNAISFDWNQARAFLATAEEGSLSAAARALNTTQPTIGRQVSALEETLEVALFERVGRGLLLTHAGRELAAHIGAMRDAATRVSLTASSHSEVIEGEVCITASDVMAVYALPEFLKKLHQIAPKMDVTIDASNSLQDLQRREADIAIRHVRPDQPELIARLVREDTAHFYASPEYLNHFGRPKDKADLIRHKLISFGEPDQTMRYLDTIGITLERSNFLFHSENGLVSWEMTKAGLGIGIMGDLIARQTPAVEQVLPDTTITYPVWLTTHKELHTSKRIRLVFDLLDAHLREARP